MPDVCGLREEQMARALDLLETPPVCAGAGDNAAAAVDTATVGDGQCNASLGTSGTIFISGRRFGAAPNNALHVFAHADGSYHLMGCMLSAAACNKWLLAHAESSEAARGAVAALDGENIDIAASDIPFCRLQCDSGGKLRAYTAQGGVLPVQTRSFGGIGVFAILKMGRFYRHVLIRKRCPHHGAVAFGHYGRPLFGVMKLPGAEDIAYNQPRGLRYPAAPFA